MLLQGRAIQFLRGEDWTPVFNAVVLAQVACLERQPARIKIGRHDLLQLLAFGAGSVAAQSRTRLFDIELGVKLAGLPLDEWVDPACGTNGGPPSVPLDGFEAFARCPVEAATGLREIWFIYDDEWEYIGRAQRDEAQIGRYSANTLYRQPIVSSLLIDKSGVVQGYRIVTDPRAPVDRLGPGALRRGRPADPGDRDA